MKIELKIPRGWRRVRRGKVKKGDMIAWDWSGTWEKAAVCGDNWDPYHDGVPDIGMPTFNFNCVIRRAT